MALGLVTLKQKALAQIDPHFTQNYVYPMAVNPALTGSMEGGYRVSSVYRNQWRNITNPYSTIGVSAELVAGKNINIGTSFFRQTAGDSGYQYSLGNISLAYDGVKFGRDGDQTISFGIQGGFIKSKFDANNFTFGEQWLPGTGYNPGINSGENLNNLSSSVLDLSFGISYFDRTLHKGVLPFAGFSIYHLTQPVYSFLADGNNNKLPMRYSGQAGLRISLNEGFLIVPNVIYNRQQEASEFIAAMYADFYVNDNTNLMLGGNMRIKDSISPFIGLYSKGFLFGLSYDVNTSSIGSNVSNTNAFELSISFSGGKRRDYNSGQLYCPKF